MISNAQKLILFFKAPRPGLVKSRLAVTIGADAAASACRRMLSVLVEKLASLPAVELRFAPDDALNEIAAWHKPGWFARPQGSGDLGARLDRAFVESFAEGAERVVIIGSDCPDVTVEDIRAAWAALESHDVVIGPAKDGGYWLIGLRAAQAELFERMAWSTPEVFQETLRRSRNAGLSVRLLAEKRDIDTEIEWREFLLLQRGKTNEESSPLSG